MHWVQLKKKETEMFAPCCTPFPLPCAGFGYGWARVEVVGLLIFWKSHRSRA